MQWKDNILAFVVYVILKILSHTSL